MQSSLQNSQTIELNTSNRGSLSVTIEKSFPSPVTASQLNNLQMATNLSNTKMKRQVIPFLRDVSGRKNVESFSDTYLQERDSALSEYFSIHLHKAPSHEENTENSGFDCVPIIY